MRLFITNVGTRGRKAAAQQMPFTENSPRNTYNENKLLGITSFIDITRIALVLTQPT